MWLFILEQILRSYVKNCTCNSTFCNCYPRHRYLIQSLCTGRELNHIHITEAIYFFSQSLRHFVTLIKWSIGFLILEMCYAMSQNCFWRKIESLSNFKFYRFEKVFKFYYIWIGLFTSAARKELVFTLVYLTVA